MRGRDDLFAVFDNLNTYPVTMHFNGQSRVELDGDQATGLSCCRAHHIIGAGADPSGFHPAVTLTGLRNRSAMNCS
ncbi:MAG: nuclear transport factor 2 family protein [Paracoccus sp. (in: a-proteobacteria)]|nr:nuclear transport factor 2 family protein [Paracoccus sp. (in: a-proteobacteria)]